MITELLQARTMTRKVWDLGDGKAHRWECHLGNIHYQDSNRVLQDIDTTLRTRAGGTFQDKCPYLCELPTLASGDFNFFNTDHDFNVRIVGILPVAGQPDTDEWGKIGKSIIYSDAFGLNIHLIAQVRNQSFAKLIRFDAAPLDTTKDFLVAFELLTPPTLVEYKDANGTFVTYDLTRTETLATKVSDTLIRFTRAAQFSYIRQSHAWDSNPINRRRLPVRFAFYQRLGKSYLVKIIPKEIFQNAVYPIFADDPVTYYAGAGDGMIEKPNQTTWALSHDATSGDAYPTDTVSDAGCGATPNFNVMRTFMPTDTSGITDTDTVTAVTINLYATAKSDQDDDGDDWINIVGATTQASNTTLASADFNDCGAVANPTEWATRIDLGAITTSAYNIWTGNATMVAAVNKTGFTLLGVREGHDCIDSAIQTSAINRATFSTSEATGTAQDPYLDVTSSVAGGGGPFPPWPRGPNLLIRL